MRYEVMMTAVADTGEILWGFHHDEVVVPGEDAEANALRLAGKLVERVDEGRAAIMEQAGLDVGFVAGEQEEAERGR